MLGKNIESNSKDVFWLLNFFLNLAHVGEKITLTPNNK